MLGLSQLGLGGPGAPITLRTAFMGNVAGWLRHEAVEQGHKWVTVVLDRMLYVAKLLSS